MVALGSAAGVPAATSRRSYGRAPDGLRRYRERCGPVGAIPAGRRLRSNPVWTVSDDTLVAGLAAGDPECGVGVRPAFPTTRLRPGPHDRARRPRRRGHRPGGVRAGVEARRRPTTHGGAAWWAGCSRSPATSRSTRSASGGRSASTRRRCWATTARPTGPDPVGAGAAGRRQRPAAGRAGPAPRGAVAGDRARRPARATRHARWARSRTSRSAPPRPASAPRSIRLRAALVTEERAE